MSVDQEAQTLTDKVLNIKFSLEKLNQQKQSLEEEIKTLTTENTMLKKSNEDFIKANKEFESILQELNVKIKAKEVELAESTAIYKEEIDKKFEQIAERQSKQDHQDTLLRNREEQIMKDEASLIERQKNIEASVLQAEHQEKQNAVKEVELKRQADNQTTFYTVLKQKEDELIHKEGNNKLFEKSLLDREQELITKLNTIGNREQQLIQLKNAVDNDRINNENEKNRNSYVLRVLEDIQKRCISNVGQKITEDTISKITQKVINIYEPVEPITPIVDKTILEPAPIVEEVVVQEEVIDEPVEMPVEEIHEEITDIPNDEEPIVETQDIPADDDTEPSKEGLGFPNEKLAEISVESKPLSELSREELEAMAKEKGIRVMSNWKIETIIKKLEN